MSDKPPADPKPVSHTANISTDYYCGSCGWPIVEARVNDEMVPLHPRSDYWLYCSNQGCKHHGGSDFDSQHGEPEWAIRRGSQSHE